MDPVRVIWATVGVVVIAFVLFLFLRIAGVL